MGAVLRGFKSPVYETMNRKTPAEANCGRATDRGKSPERSGDRWPDLDPHQPSTLGESREPMNKNHIHCSAALVAFWMRSLTAEPDGGGINPNRRQAL